MAGGAANFLEEDQSYINATSSPAGSAGAPVAVLSDLSSEVAQVESPNPSAFNDVNAGDTVSVEFSATVSPGGSPQTDANAIAQNMVSGNPVQLGNVSITYSTPGPPAAYTASVTLTALSV